MERNAETDSKLDMSLDALIGKSSQDQRQERGPGRGQGNRGGFPGRQGRGRSQRNGEQVFGRNVRRTNTGLVMPDFSRPFRGFPQPQQFSEPLGFAPMPYGFMPPDHMMGMPAEPPMPPNMPAGSFFRGAAMPPAENPLDAEEPPAPAGPAAVPQARLEEESGQVTVTFKGNQIVRIAREGTITLDSGGVRGPAVFMALNAVLNVVGVSITRPKKDDEWSISDGRSLMRFTDGVLPTTVTYLWESAAKIKSNPSSSAMWLQETLPAKGPQSTQRGPKILAAFGGADPSAAAAATAASNAAAAAAGIILNNRPASGRGRGQRAPSLRGRGGSGGGRGSEIMRYNGAPELREEGEPGSGGKSEEDRIRRLAAKGRYRPY